MIDADRYVYSILSESGVNDFTAGEIHTTVRNEEDEKRNRLPYIIIDYMGGENISETKDDVEGNEDQEAVSVVCVAESREQLHQLAIEARAAIIKDFQSDERSEGSPTGYSVKFGSVRYDEEKDCYWQTLDYIFITDNTLL